MCSISVDPIPSMIFTPVASLNACQTAPGRCSPAETAARSEDSRCADPPASIALYAVGAVKQTVTPCSSIRSPSSSGAAFSIISVEAPARSGKISTPPRPKVNAIGGVPVNTSSGVGASRCAEKVSAIARTSRWKCMVALGRPVVPEVNARSATSSAAVSTAAKSPGRFAQRRTRSSAASPP